MKKLIALAFLAVLAVFPAEARLRGGMGVSQGVSAQIAPASFQLLNNGASTTPASFVTNMFTQAFKSCSIAPGQCIANGCTTGSVIMKIHGGSGTPLLFSESTAPVCWNDGSLRHASFLLTYSAAAGIAPGAGNAVTIDVYTGGTMPTASARSTADLNPSSSFGGNCDLNIQVTPLDTTLAAGTWTAAVWDAVQNNGHEYPVVSPSHRNKGADYVDVDGPSGTVWRIRAPFKQLPGSTTPQGQLEAWFYIQDLQDASGNFYGFRELSRTTLPYYNNPCVGSTCLAQNMMSFTTWYLCNGNYGACTSSGTGLLVDLWAGVALGGNTHETVVSLQQNASGGPATPTPSVASNIYGNNLWEFGNLVQLSSVPAGSALSANTSYFVFNGSGGPNGGYNNNVFVESKSNIVSPDLSWNCTTLPCNYTGRTYPWLSPFGSLFDATPTAQYNYERCNGSGPAADVNVQVLPAVIYWRGAGVIPPYAFKDYFPYQGHATGNPTAGAQLQGTLTTTQTNFWGMTSGPVDRGLEDTGERSDIGLMPGWDANYFNRVAWGNSSYTDEITARATGLAIGAWPTNVRDFGTNTLPTVNDGPSNSGNDYPGLIGVCANVTGHTCTFTAGTPCTSLSICPQWNKFAYDSENSAQTIGLTFPTNQNATLAGYNTFNTSHWPMTTFPAYMITGEPQYRDLLQEEADTGILQRVQGMMTTLITPTVYNWANGGSNNARNFTICSNPPTCSSTLVFYGAPFDSNNEIRKDAWAHNVVAEAAFFNYPESAGASEHSYYVDLEASFAGALQTFQAWEENVNSFAATSGIFNEGANQLTPWTLAYFIGANGFAYELTLDATDITNFKDLMKWPNYVDQLTDPVTGNKVGPASIAAYEYLDRVCNGTPPCSPSNTTTGATPIVQFSTSPTDPNGNITVAPGQYIFTWTTTAGNTFKQALQPFQSGWGGYVPTVGDEVLFCGSGGDCGAALGEGLPNGFSANTPYFMNTVQGSTQPYTFTLAPYSSTCNRTNQSGCVTLSYGTGTQNCGAGCISGDAEVLTATVPGTGTGTTACSAWPYNGSAVCESTGTRIGNGTGTCCGYASTALGYYTAGQAALNFYNCQIGSCTTGFSAGPANQLQMFTDLVDVVLSDTGDFPGGYTSYPAALREAFVPDP